MQNRLLIKLMTIGILVVLVGCGDINQLEASQPPLDEIENGGQTEFLDLSESEFFKNTDETLPILTRFNDMVVGKGSLMSPAEDVLISLQGYGDSAERMAAVEWLAFLESYDQDKVIFDSIMTDLAELIEVYGEDPHKYDQISDMLEWWDSELYVEYGVYTQEMAEKLDEIATNCGLSLQLGEDIWQDIGNSNEELFRVVGTGDFLGTSSSVQGGMAHNSGLFRFVGVSDLSILRDGHYTFESRPKGIFYNMYSSISDMDIFEDWIYETASGVVVLIASSEHNSLIFADLPNSFVNISLLGDTAQALEDFADSIDFSMLMM